MSLSAAERSYLYDGLSQTPLVRPDSRKANQFRPVEASSDFLASSNGSSKVKLSDGSECVVSIKAQVVSRTQQRQDFIEVDVDIPSIRDDSNLISNLCTNLRNSISKNFPLECLKLTEKFCYKLYIDAVVLAHFSHPLTLLSLGIYLALKSTRLPLLISNVNDREIEEQPTFSDDWQDSYSLFPDDKYHPPILFVLAIIGDNVILDPSNEEENVCDNSVMVSFSGRRPTVPFQSVNVSTERKQRGFTTLQLVKALKLVEGNGKYVTAALDEIVAEENEAD